MGRHSRPDPSGPATEPSGWGGLRHRLPRAGSDGDAANEGTAVRGAATSSGSTSNGGARRSGPGNDVLTRPADQTQVIPRLTGPATSTWPATLVPPAIPAAPASAVPATSDPTAKSTPARPASNEETAVFPRPEVDRPASDDPHTAEASPTPAPTTDEAPLWGDDDDTDADAGTNHQRLMWPALVVFWLLALGAGVVTLASLGAPHYLCTGAAKGLACHRTGTAIAAVLTVLVIAVVGVVSVFAIEARRRGLLWLRHLGIGVVVLALVAGGGYLLIRTIGG